MKPFLRMLSLIGALITALMIIRPAIAAPPVDWTQVAARTPAGNMIQGNPNAPVKLIEYLSLTCPHCAHFEGTAGALGPKYIKPGLVSYEVRIGLRDPFDLVAALLSRCAGPRAFFVVKPALYAAQGIWLEKGLSWSSSGPDFSKMAEADVPKAVAKGSGLDIFFARHGLAPARANACLANVPEQKLLAKLGDGVWAIPNFPGTPAFSINGTMAQGITEWPDLDKQLATAVAKSGRH